jgi:hypothetical protein
MSACVRPLALAAILSLAAPLVSAQSGAGSVTGTFGLDDARWVVAGSDAPQPSTWTESGEGDEIRMVATPEAGGEGGEGTLVITLTAETGATEASLTSARIEYRGEGRDLIAEGENVDLTLTAFEPAGSDVAVAGSFAAMLTPGGASGLVIEAEAGRRIDGNFQATIPRAGADAGAG